MAHVVVEFVFQNEILVNSKALVQPSRRTCFPHWPSYITLLVFLAFWGGFITIGFVAFRHGKIPSGILAISLM